MTRGRQRQHAHPCGRSYFLGILVCCVSLFLWTVILSDQTFAQPPPQQQEYQPQAQPPSQQQQQALSYTDRDRTLRLASDRSRYDSAELSRAEVQGSAVSAFCKSFSFLCHLRCLQRGDPHDAGNIGPNTCGSPSNGGRGGEINRCAFVSDRSQSNSVRVLCVCSNGVDLTAEVDYALEGVIDNGQNNAGAGEAGMIRQVAYSTKKVTVTKTLPAVTRTTTLTHVVWSSTTFTQTSTVTVTATHL